MKIKDIETLKETIHLNLMFFGLIISGIIGILLIEDKIVMMIFGGCMVVSMVIVFCFEQLIKFMIKQDRKKEE